MSKSKPHRSAAQAEQSRKNGAKSQGPTTPAGKCKVSHNHMVHGFRSKAMSIHTEDRPAYDFHLDAYLARYTPIDKVEEDLVGLLAISMWQVMRNNSIEVALFDLEISGIDEHFEGQYQSMDQYGRLALAFKKSAGENALELLRRYKSTSERAYHRALQALEQIQKDRKSPQPAPAAAAGSSEDVDIFSAVQTRQLSVSHPIALPVDSLNENDNAPLPKKVSPMTVRPLHLPTAGTPGIALLHPSVPPIHQPRPTAPPDPKPSL